MERVTITTYRDGPLLVRGPVVIQDQEGRDLGLAAKNVALCRCGKSRVRPLCDGSHKLVGFHAPSGAEDWRSGQRPDGDGRSSGRER